ncbi:lytic polysaccharide monooxygenase [Nocardiopsis sp. MG754419]|uniref:lytic polysaccharide monooxygenase auxiliary activity family 9 protein n=1 Tax=Nocardiopsis sp. MG754419 TaxID=2259865 RepID=UPI001BAC2488|nr:lytic polysaccharide monooxygenase [Nocardiopsis sp. MG754419]MBR8744476.1 cell wall protein [Nocardiopsis sp. MG754419]
MRFGRLARSAAVLVAAPVTIAGLAAAPAQAHGTLGDPISRIAACYAEGPESPQSEMCVRLVEENGTQPLYDWHEVNIANADGQHREIIPDGQLCSAGRDKYSALDNPGDWASTAVTELPSGADHTFEYTAAVPHAGYIEYYVTTDDWDPSTPLTWDELESEPFAVDDQPVAEDGTYTMTAQLPEKSGQHLVYTIWQRTDSPEAFYSCSDVTFGGESAAVATSAADTEAFSVDPAAYADLDHADHAQDEDTVTTGTNDSAETTESDTEDAGETDAAPVADHGSHASGGTELAATGSAVTALFATAIALMAAGAAALHLARRRRGTV